MVRSPMSRHDEYAIEQASQADGDASGAGWVGCCGWFCILGGLPMLALFFPAGLGLMVLGALLLSGKPTIQRAEDDMSEAVRGKGVTPETVGWLARTGFIGTVLIVGAFVVAVWLMLLARSGGG